MKLTLKIQVIYISLYDQIIYLDIGIKKLLY